MDKSFRWVLAVAMVVGLGACGKEAKDIALDDVMKADNQTLLREQLTTQEQMRLAKHMSMAMATGQLDGSKTVGEALEEEAAAMAAAEADREQRDKDRKAREENFYAVMGETGVKTAEIKDPMNLTLLDVYMNYQVHREELLKVMGEEDLNLVMAAVAKDPPLPGRPSAEMTVGAALAAAKAGQ